MSIKAFRPTVLITAGGTTESIDNVRCMTNVSTGATGARIAEFFLANGWEVIYIHGQGAEKPHLKSIKYPGSLGTYEAVSADDMLTKIKHQTITRGDRVDAIIMSAAVSDFTFDLTGDIKLDSSDALGFINYLRDTIRSNVKILPRLRTMAPESFIVGFKYTVGATLDEQYAIAKAQNLKANINATFVNDDVDMKESGDRRGSLVYGDCDVYTKSVGRDSIAHDIYTIVSEDVRIRSKDYINKKLLTVKKPEVS